MEVSFIRGKIVQLGKKIQHHRNDSLTDSDYTPHFIRCCYKPFGHDCSLRLIVEFLLPADIAVLHDACILLCIK